MGSIIKVDARGFVYGRIVSLSLELVPAPLWQVSTIYVSLARISQCIPLLQHVTTGSSDLEIRETRGSTWRRTYSQRRAAGTGFEVVRPPQG